MNREALQKIRAELNLSPKLQSQLPVTFDLMREVIEAILDDSDHTNVWKDSPPKPNIAKALHAKAREQQRKNSP